MFDKIIAESCIIKSTIRHSGILTQSYTPKGKVFIQRGKDLRAIKKIIGTGGYLSGAENAEIFIEKESLESEQSIPLIPEYKEFYTDSEYLFPILGNIVHDYPNEAVALATNNLVKIKSPKIGKKR